MIQLSSRLHRGAWVCALGALVIETGCGGAVVTDGSGGSGDVSTGAGGAGAAATTGDAGMGGAPAEVAPLWSKAFDDAYPFSVAVDPSGNIIVAGFFHDSVDFGGEMKLVSAGNRDAFVVKLDASGQVLWSRSFGDADGQWARSVAVDGAGNVVITGSFSGAIDFGAGALVAPDSLLLGFVAKLDPAGNHLWSKAFGDGSGMASFVAAFGSGDVLVTGGFVSSVDLGGGPILGSMNGPDVFLAKLDPAGNHLWSKGFSGGVEVQSIAVDAKDDAWITGTFLGPVDFGGGELPGGATHNVYAAKLDPAGEHLWSKGFSSSSGSEGGCVGADGSGAVVLAGHFAGDIDLGAGELLTSSEGADLFVAKLGPTETLWSKRFSSIAGDGLLGCMVSTSCAVSTTGDVILTGAFGVTLGDPSMLGEAIDFGGGPLVSEGAADVFVAKLRPDGGHHWSIRAGDPYQQYGTGVAVDGSGNSIVTGAFSGTIDLGSGTLWSPEGMFLAMFGP
jgi:hypothetical protein